MGERSLNTHLAQRSCSASRHRGSVVVSNALIVARSQAGMSCSIKGVGRRAVTTAASERMVNSPYTGTRRAFIMQRKRPAGEHTGVTRSVGYPTLSSHNRLGLSYQRHTPAGLVPLSDMSRSSDPHPRPSPSKWQRGSHVRLAPPETTCVRRPAVVSGWSALQFGGAR